MPTVRLVTLSVSILFSVILLAMSSHLVSLFSDAEAFPLVAIAASVLTLPNSSLMIFVGIRRRGAFPSKIIYELVSLPILSILFLACGASAANSLSFTFLSAIDCSQISDLGDELTEAETACHEHKAIQAFAFLTWILLGAYSVVLLTLSIIASSRSKPVWFTSVKDAVFFPPKAGPIIAPPGQMAGIAPQYQTTGNTTSPVAPTQHPYGQQPTMVASPGPGQHQGQVQPGPYAQQV